MSETSLTPREKKRQIVQFLHPETPNGYWPEQEVVYYSTALNIILSAGEGSGKSDIGSMKALTAILVDHLPVGLGWVIGWSYEDARREADFIYDWADELGVLDKETSSRPSAKDHKVTIHIVVPATLTDAAIDYKIETISAKDPLNIGRETVDFIIGAEVSRWDVEAWRRAQGRLARQAHAWGYFSGSPETDEGWFSQIYEQGTGPNEEGIVSYNLASSVNRTLYPLGDLDPKIAILKGSMSGNRFKARHLGLPVAAEGAVLPGFRNSLHVHDTLVSPYHPVYVFIDPGTHLYAVEFVQLYDGFIYVVDEVYMPDASHDAVITAVTMRPAWRQVKEGVIDVAGTQHHFGQGSPEEAWARETGLQLKAKYWAVADTEKKLQSVMGINPFTQRPYLRIAPHCVGLISELGGMPSPVAGRGVWKREKNGKPQTLNCDALKALGYGLLALQGTLRADQHKGDDWDDDTGEPDNYLSEPRGRQGYGLQQLIDRHKGRTGMY